MSIIGNIKQDPRYDLVYSKKTIEKCKEYLNENEKFFHENVENKLKNIENICVSVDEDCDSYEYINEQIKEDEIKELLIVPTYITYDEFADKFDKKIGIKDWNTKIEIYKVIESFYKELNYDGDIQLGGYVIWPIQYGYDNFIGYYYGEYGDAGAVYLYLTKENNISSSVDMH